MKVFFRLLLVSALFLISVSLMAPATGELALEEEARLRLAEAFGAVADAERMGGDVFGLVEELNDAVILLEKAEMEGDEELLRDALLKVEGVIAEASVVGQSGATEVEARVVWSWLVVGLVVALAAIVWRYEPRVFWRLWVWSKRGWKVKS